MLTAAATLAFAITSAALTASAREALPSSSVMPLVIGITAASDLSPSLVAAVLDEADAVWRAAGFRFVWQRDAGMSPANLRVIIGGGLSKTPGPLPLAWISLGEDGMPAPRIYVSAANAMALLRLSRDTVGLVDVMPIIQRDTYLARALGRSLAHEVGHYLMGSRAHAAKGLMMASHTSQEFFSPERRSFRIDAQERQRMAARFSSIYMASRQ